MKVAAKTASEGAVEAARLTTMPRIPSALDMPLPRPPAWYMEEDPPEEDVSEDAVYWSMSIRCSLRGKRSRES